MRRNGMGVSLVMSNAPLSADAGMFEFDKGHAWRGEAAGQVCLQGIQVARRTVAKYRTELNILPKK